MFNEIMSLALGNGLWAALFCLLFLYQLKDSRAREKKYTVTISSLTHSLGGLKNVKADCENIKADCKVILADCGFIRAESGKALEGITELRRKNSRAPKKDVVNKNAAYMDANNKDIGKIEKRDTEADEVYTKEPDKKED